MKPKLHDAVLELSLKIVEASSIADTRGEWRAYQQLLSLCEDNENSSLNHPFQWEALADFTSDDRVSITIYQKALEYAEQADLREYSASIKLAIAEAYIELGNTELAIVFGTEADDVAKLTNDLELQEEIGDFLLNATKSLAK